MEAKGLFHCTLLWVGLCGARGVAVWWNILLGSMGWDGVWTVGSQACLAPCLTLHSQAAPAPLAAVTVTVHSLT